MAYDEALAGRIRELVADEPNVTENTLFPYTTLFRSRKSVV